jgi:hypothetical protein
MKKRTPLHQLFPLGHLVFTGGAMGLISRTGTTVSSLLGRHSFGDWGGVCESDKRLNDRAVVEGARILSAYELGPGREVLWLITEADRSATTFLLPEEY